MKSGEKNLQRYALEESHQFYKDGYKILSEKTSLSNVEERLLIDLLIKWFFVFAWRADPAGARAVLDAHRDLVDSLEDRERQGMFYACLGCASGQAGYLRESYEYLLYGLKLCRGVKNKKFMTYCYFWLTQACGELGLLDEAIAFGNKGQAIAESQAWDPLLFIDTKTWMGLVYFYRGECAEIEKIANTLLKKGIEKADPRTTSYGYHFKGVMFQVAGDFNRSIEEFEKAIGLAKDPVALCSGKMMLGMSYLSLGRFQEAEDNLNEILLLIKHVESWVQKTNAEFLLNAVLVARGNLSHGIKNLHSLQAHFSANGQKSIFTIGEYILGNIYFQLIQSEAPKDFKMIIKNIGFLIKTLPFAAKKAERHFQTAIQTAKEIGAKGVSVSPIWA